MTASSGKAVPCRQDAPVCATTPNGNQPRLFVKSIQMLGMPASVSFSFDRDGKLAETLVRFSNADFALISNLLQGIHGEAGRGSSRCAAGQGIPRRAARLDHHRDPDRRRNADGLSAGQRAGLKAVATETSRGRAAPRGSFEQDQCRRASRSLVNPPADRSAHVSQPKPQLRPGILARCLAALDPVPRRAARARQHLPGAQRQGRAARAELQGRTGARRPHAGAAGQLRAGAHRSARRHAGSIRPSRPSSSSIRAPAMGPASAA